MFTADILRDLYLHMCWADARAWAAISRLEDPEAAIVALRERLFHLHAVQRGFLLVWTGQPVAFPRPADFHDLPALREWAEPTYAEALAFLETLTEKQLRQPLHMPWALQFEKNLGPAASEPTLAETIFQVISHSTHHRGQVLSLLRDLGGDPPVVDFIAWVWLGRPESERG